MFVWNDAYFKWGSVAIATFLEQEVDVKKKWKMFIVKLFAATALEN